MRAAETILALLLLAGLAGSSARADEKEPDPEARRLDAREFRDGLRQRGLIELLEYQLNQSPPADEAEAALLRRELLLAAADDPSRPKPERAKALVEADRILQDLIVLHPKHESVLQWRLDLAGSLLYRHGEPLALRLLYRGADPAARRSLFDLMSRVVNALDELLTALEAEYQRIDELGLAEYERLERKGYVQRIEQMQPHAKYIRRWAVFYRVLARDRDDPVGFDELRYVTDDLRDATDLLTAPHEESHLQAQSLLLSGMAHRLLGDHDAALEQLEAAIGTVDRLADPVERRDLQWAITLARLERVKALRDARRYERALAEADDFRQWVAITSASNLGLELVASLLEASIYRAQARRARTAGTATLARRIEERALSPLIALARKSDAHRNAVYATLAENIDPQRDPATLHPFERAALVAVLLGEADSLDAPRDVAGAPSGEAIAERRTQLLGRAIGIARGLLADAGGLDRELVAEVRYNLAVASLRRGDRLEAVDSFLTVARDHPTFRLAETAAAAAVQTAAEIYEDPGLGSRPEVRDLYLETLTVLESSYPRGTAAAYWQFFLAQTLEEAGRHRQAAEQYARVAPTHEFHAQASFQRVRCLVRLARAASEQPEADRAEIARRAAVAASSAGHFVEAAEAGRFASLEAAQLDRLVARATVAQAETYALPGVNDYRGILDSLDGFERRHPAAHGLIGRVLRVRIIAYKALNLLDEARQAIPRYIESDPAHAGATLQGLLDATTAEINRLRRGGRTDDAQREAEAALLLARQLDAWARNQAAGLGQGDRYALRVQLAEAHLAAGQSQEAHGLFEQCLATRAAMGDAAAHGDARAVLGLAEADFQLERYIDALPLYNRVFREALATSDLWWRALLGDLRCRTELGQDPSDIVRVIRQQRFLHPDLGGPWLRAGFEALLQRNDKADHRQ